MYAHRPNARNRLLALEQELFPRGRWGQHNHLEEGNPDEKIFSPPEAESRLFPTSYSPFPIPDLQVREQQAVDRREYFRSSAGRPQKTQLASPAPSNNRLFDLEQQLRSNTQRFEESSPNETSFTAQSESGISHSPFPIPHLQVRDQQAVDRREYFQSPANPQKRSRKQSPKTPKLSFKAYVFDTGASIIVEYPGDGVNEKRVGGTIKKQTRGRGDAETRRREIPTKNSFTPGDGEENHLPQWTSQSEPELVTTLSDESNGEGDWISETVATQQNVPRTTSEAIATAPNQNNSHKNRFSSKFGNIGDEMKHATYFDLGEVEIESPFDEFDRKMAQEQSWAKAQAARKFEVRFDEFDRDLSLGESSTKTDLPPPRGDGEMGRWGDGGEGKKGWGAEEQRSGGVGEEERTDNFWIQTSRNPTQNFVHPGDGEIGRTLNPFFLHLSRRPEDAGIQRPRDAENTQTKSSRQPQLTTYDRTQLNLFSPTLSDASISKSGTAIQAIARTESLVEVLPYDSLLWQETSPMLWLFDFGLMALLQPMNPAPAMLLPVIARVLFYTLAFLAALAKVFLLTLAIKICFVTRTTAEPWPNFLASTTRSPALYP
ncbi:MAG: hypothetical protein F6J92_07990 [Symploca sp. SIO1A3]|nr:hypothetical protein [Symploca sp. SIO1A3]